VKCYNCKDFGHYAWECPKKGKEEKALIAEGYASDEPTLMLLVSEGGVMLPEDDGGVMLLASEGGVMLLNR